MVGKSTFIIAFILLLNLHGFSQDSSPCDCVHFPIHPPECVIPCLLQTASATSLMSSLKLDSATAHAIANAPHRDTFKSVNDFRNAIRPKEFQNLNQQINNYCEDSSRIITPANGAIVQSTGMVEVYSPCTNTRNVYVLITAPDGNKYLQPQATVGTNGAWSTTVNYGDGTTDSGSIFYVSSIITDSILTGKRNPHIPQYAISTESINVTLTK